MGVKGRYAVMIENNRVLRFDDSDFELFLYYGPLCFARGFPSSRGGHVLVLQLSEFRTAYVPSSEDPDGREEGNVIITGCLRLFPQKSETFQSAKNTTKTGLG